MSRPLLLTILCLGLGCNLAGCAALGNFSRQSSWRDAMTLCSNDPQGCKNKCAAGGGPTCDFILVRSIEDYPDGSWTQYATHAAVGPGDVAGIKARLQPYCDAGIARACKASDALGATKRETSKGRPGPASGPSTAVAGAQPPKTEPRTQGEVMAEARGIAEAAKKRAEKALAVVNDAETSTLAEQVANCRPDRKRCFEMADAMENRVAMLAGKALLLAHSAEVMSRMADATEAETLADEALAEAKRTVGARERLEAEASNELGGLNEARTACDSNPNACRLRCEKSEYIMCIAWGGRFAKEKKYADARAFFKKACDGQSALGCLLVSEVTKAEKEDKQQGDALWSPVVSSADDIAQRRHMASFARQNAPTARNLAAAQRVDAHVASLIRDSYCPAVKAFLKRSTRADFQARAKDHCDQEPPTGTGLGGEQVVLTAGCRQVFATPCS